MDLPAKHFYEFGPFRLETGERILLREGQFVILTPKIFDTLLVLVESGGRILDKEDLLKKVWPDTIVEEVSLAKKISLLRKVLGEDAGHHYIETIPRRGYRFVAEVREVWEESSAQAPPANGHNGTWRAQQPADKREEVRTETAAYPVAASDPIPVQAKRFARRLVWAGSLLTVGLLAGLTLWWLVIGSATKASKSSLPTLNAVPLTSFQGHETQAAFSPDGSQIAFVWDGPQGDNQDIRVVAMQRNQQKALISQELAANSADC